MPKAPAPAKKRRPRKPEPFWMLVQAKRGQEQWATKNARNQGFTVFNPRWQQHLKGRLQAFFPGYIFVLRDSGPGLAPLRNTYGVLSIVGGRDGPWRVPHREIKRLMRAQDSEGILRTEEQMALIMAAKQDSRKLKPGEAVEFKAGAFKGLPAVYKGQTPDQHIQVIFRMMGQDIPMVVERKEVRPVK